LRDLQKLFTQQSLRPIVCKRNNAVETLRSERLPLAGIVTPNLPDAEVQLKDKLATASQCSKLHCDKSYISFS
jgi:hydroxymethylpyrimidine/phosphomethylpyrimidine kinase